MGGRNVHIFGGDDAWISEHVLHLWTASFDGVFERTDLHRNSGGLDDRPDGGYARKEEDARGGGEGRGRRLGRDGAAHLGN